MKKYGGVIDNWQIHNLSFLQEDIDKVYPEKNAKPMVFTGTVVYDPIGRWERGNHMRSSLIVSIDKEKGIIETLKTIYKVLNEGDSVTEDMAALLKRDSKDLGDDVMNIFY